MRRRCDSLPETYRRVQEPPVAVRQPWIISSAGPYNKSTNKDQDRGRGPMDWQAVGQADDDGHGGGS